MKHKSLLILVATLVGAAFTGGLPGQGGSEERAPTIGRAVRHGISRPLRDIVPRRPIPGPPRQVPNVVGLTLPRGLAPETPAADAVRQTTAEPTSTVAVTPEPMLSFEGTSDDDNASILGFRIVPPDTEGDVGISHYIQMNNLVFEIFDKVGNTLLGPLANNSLWSGFGGPCEKENDGDPIVLYDHLAHRWVFSQFAIGVDGHQCFAVSTGEDPTGSYFLYDFVISPGAFNDYPKIGVWPDAYYLSANEFDGSFNGAIAVAFERDEMLAGNSAQFVKFGPLACGSECFYSLQPSHLEGPDPLADTPNTYIMAFDDETWGTGFGHDGYRLWEFSVDWSYGQYSFTSLGQVDTPEFDANLCNFGPCVPQPKRRRLRGEVLDALSQFTMYRAQFRRFATYDSIVVNHTVDADGNDLAGIRWAELRNDGNGWDLHQTGTYAPDDGEHRWMGSIAMDRSGNIALGFSVSSQGTFPSIRYVTRMATDPLGTLPGGEVELIAGSGVQQSSFNRWGDYSSMSVDPMDDCTFWYTQEYYENSGAFDWKTRIGSFKLDSCGVPPPDITDIAITNLSAPSSVVEGTIVEVSVTVANVGNQDVDSTISVTLMDDTDGSTIGSPQTISSGLLAGGSSVRNFSWNTGGASLSEHTLIASHNFADDNEDNDSGSTVVKVTDATPPAGVTVTSIDPDTLLTGTMIDVNVRVMGLGFVNGAQVTFENGSGPAPTASNVVVDSSSMAITAKVTAKSSGPRGDSVWDVRVTNTDGSFDVLPGGFTVNR